MKKKILVLVCLLLFIVGCSSDNNDGNKDVSNSDLNQSVAGKLNYADNVEVESVLKSTTIADFEYILFNIQVMGLYNNVINRDVLDGITKYSFTLTPKYKDKNVELHYDGVYFKDIITMLKVEDYEKVMFSDKDGNTMTVKKNQIEDTLLIFRANEKDLNEWGPAKVVVTTYETHTWLENIVSVTFK